MKAPLYKRRWVIVVAVIVIIITGGFLVAHFRSSRLTFAEFEELVTGPEGSGATMWKGVYYCGEEDGLAHFCNQLWWQRRYVAIPVGHTKGFPKLENTFFSSRWINASRSDFIDGSFVYQPK